MNLTIEDFDASCLTIYDLKITCGRDDVYSQPDGSVLEAELIGYTEHGAMVGRKVTVTDEYGRLFAGWVTDLTAGYATADGWRMHLSATGPLALLGQYVAGVDDWPVETDSQRVARAVGETELGPYLAADLTVEGFNIAARTGKADNAASLARLAADSAHGVLWENPAEVEQPLRYTPAKYRTWNEYLHSWGELPGTWDDLPDDMAWQDLDSDALPVEGIPPTLDLDCATVHAEIEFEQTVGDVIRMVEVSYKDPDDIARPAPILAGSGAPSKKFDTALDSLSDATAFANTVLERNSEPLWRLSSAILDMGLVTDKATVRNSLQVGTKVIVNMPLGSPVGTVWQGFLEGWEHVITDAGHIVNLNLSDRYLTEPAIRWIHIPNNTLWDDIEGSWDDATYGAVS